MGQGTGDAVVLRYAGIAAKTMRETDETELSRLREEMRELEEALGLTKEEILSKAAKLLVR